MTRLTSHVLRLALVLSCAALGQHGAGAQDITKEASAFVQSLSAQAVDTAADKTLTASDRERRFHDMFVESFDVPEIGRFVLGRYWRTATESERAQFLELFEEMVIKAYAGRFTDYRGELFTVESSRLDGKDRAIVMTDVVRPNTGEPIKVKWLVRRTMDPSGKLKIADVMVEGVSMSVTQQQEFGSIIQRYGGQIGPLLMAMRERIDRQSQTAHN